MQPLEKVYWLRLALGIVAAFVCAGYGMAAGISNVEFTFNAFMNSLSLALIVYLISHYLIIKRKFILLVEKPQKLATNGIGIYFLAWLVFWVLLYTIIAGPPPA